MDLLLDLPNHLGRQAALEHALRTAIASGQLVPGSMLPSGRQLAGELGLARGTVVAAIEQLAVEGLVETRQGAATRVAHVPPAIASTAVSRRPGERRPTADFAGGDPDLTRFPRSWWTAAVRRSLGSAKASVLGYGDTSGTTELRTALAEYLGRTRGVVADPARIIVTAGFRQALAAVGRALCAGGHETIGVEDPSLWRHPALLENAGLRCVSVPVDHDGMIVDSLGRCRASAALVTPNHHMPLGVSLSPARRGELAAWLARRDGVVIEDDFDGELRYDRRPLRAFQALDPGRVVYCGTASKSVAPGLRLGWCVTPPDLVDAVSDALVSIGGPSASVVEQLAFADLLASGRYDRHVRTIRSEYRKRRDMLIAALAEAVPDVHVEGASAGLMGLIRLPAGSDEAHMVTALGERAVSVAGLATFRVGQHADVELPPAIVVNYGQPFGHHYATALAQLVDALAAALGRAGAR